MPDVKNTKAEEVNNKSGEGSNENSTKELIGQYVVQSSDFNDDDGDGYHFDGFKAKYDAIAQKFMAYGFPDNKVDSSLGTNGIDIDQPAVGFPVPGNNKSDSDSEDYCMMVQATFNGRPVESLSSFSVNESMTGSRLKSEVFSMPDGDIEEVDPNSNTQASPGTGEASTESVAAPGDSVDDPYLYYKMMRGYDAEDIQILIDEY